MKVEDVINHNGKEYVTIKEFAARKDITPQKVELMIRRGSLKAEKINGYAPVFLDWKMNLTLYSHNSHAKAQQRAKTKKLRKISEIVAPEAAVSEIKEPEVKEEPMVELIDLDGFDKEKYKDCIDPSTGEFDYDVLKTRLTAETYKQKLDKERGTLVAKSEVIDSARAIAQIVQSNLDSIPVRYTSTLIASMVSILARKGIPCSLTDPEHTEIRNNLKGVAKEIMFSVQKEIGKLMEENE